MNVLIGKPGRLLAALMHVEPAGGAGVEHEPIACALRYDTPTETGDSPKR